MCIFNLALFGIGSFCSVIKNYACGAGEPSGLALGAWVWLDPPLNQFIIIQKNIIRKRVLFNTSVQCGWAGAPASAPVFWSKINTSRNANWQKEDASSR